MKIRNYNNPHAEHEAGWSGTKPVKARGNSANYIAIPQRNVKLNINKGGKLLMNLRDEKEYNCLTCEYTL